MIALGIGAAAIGAFLLAAWVPWLVALAVFAWWALLALVVRWLLP